MASEKKRRKRLAQDRKLHVQQTKQLPMPSKDGDRRRRVFGAMVRKVIQQKQAQRDWNLDSEWLPPI